VPALRATIDNEARMRDFLAGTAQVEQEAAMRIDTKQHLFHRNVSFFPFFARTEGTS
jgi:hypothetical protein